jgi:hypothetical protein
VKIPVAQSDLALSRRLADGGLIMTRPTQTIVTESFDASKVPAFSTWWLRKTGAMAHNPKWMAKSLVALKAICEG